MKSFIAATFVILAMAQDADKKKEVKKSTATPEQIKKCAASMTKSTKACTDAAATAATANAKLSGKKKTEAVSAQATKNTKCGTDAAAANVKCLAAGSVTLMAGAAFVATAAVLF